MLNKSEFLDIVNCGDDDDCDDNLATCTDVGGSFMCMCNAGYTGIGISGSCSGA